MHYCNNLLATVFHRFMLTSVMHDLEIIGGMAAFQVQTLVAC